MGEMAVLLSLHPALSPISSSFHRMTLGNSRGSSCTISSRRHCIEEGAAAAAAAAAAKNEVSVDNVWLDIVKDRPSPMNEEDSFNGVLRKHLFVTSMDGSSSSSSGVKWAERRSAVIAVQNAIDIEAALNRVGDKLEVSDMNLVLRRLGQLRRWENACQLFEWMEQKKRISAATYSTYIIMLGRAGRAAQALRTFESLEQKYRHNPFIANSALSSLVGNWKVSKAFKLFKRLKRDGFEPDAITYSTVISACLKIRHGLSKSQSILKEMKERGMKPDVYAYGSLLRVYCSYGMESQAKALVEDMLSEGVTLTLFHYSYLLNLYAQINKPEEAEKIFSALKEGLKPNDVIYRSMLKVYSANSSVKKAEGLLKEIQESGIPIDLYMYTTMMEIYARAGKTFEAHNLLLEVRSKGILPGGNTFAVLITGYATMGDLDMVKKLEADSRNRRTGKQDVRLYNALLKAYSQLKDDNRIRETLERMAAEGVLLDIASFNILICHLCERGMFELALMIFKDIKGRRLKPNAETFTKLIAGLTQPIVQDSGEPLEKPDRKHIDLLATAYTIFKEMLSRKGCCSQPALELFIRASAIARSWPFAMEGLEALDKAGYTAEQPLYEFLLLQASEDCHYGATSEILSEVKNKGYNLRTEVLERAKETFGQLDQVRGVLDSL